MTILKTPCIAACKNNGGICSGCHRTIDEIVNWRHLSDDERDTIMEALQRSVASHRCPSCGEPAQCDISAGKDTCWCFSLEKRDMSCAVSSDACLCRKCLNHLPIA